MDVFEWCQKELFEEYQKELWQIPKKNRRNPTKNFWGNQKNGIYQFWMSLKLSLNFVILLLIICAIKRDFILFQEPFRKESTQSGVSLSHNYKSTINTISTTSKWTHGKISEEISRWILNKPWRMPCINFWREVRMNSCRFI